MEAIPQRGWKGSLNFSSNRPTGPIRSTSCDVRPFVVCHSCVVPFPCDSPMGAKEVPGDQSASHWPRPGVLPGFSQVFPEVFPPFSRRFPEFSRGFPGFSRGFPGVFPGFFLGFSGGFPGVFLGFSLGFPRFLFNFYFFQKNLANSFWDKSRNLSKIVPVLLSASVERFFVSCMPDVFKGLLSASLPGNVGFGPPEALVRSPFNS